VSRVDGAGGVSLSVNFAFQTDLTSLELALSGGLVPDVKYLFEYGPAGTGITAYIPPISQSSRGSSQDDPEAEALGIDVDWLAESLDASGDMPTIRGRDCLSNDLVAIAKTDPGELFHRPKEGGGMLSQVNGPGNDLDAVARALRATWSRDRRVKSVNTIEVSHDTDGTVTASTSVQPVALSELLAVRVTS
jgi:hypothetical protein